MAKRRIRNVTKKLTETERDRHRAIREQVEQEKPELIAQGRLVKNRHGRLREPVDALKATRKALGLSLADIKARTGIEKGNLSRMESSPNPNPTIDTLTRYADAVGKELIITLVDKPASQLAGSIGPLRSVHAPKSLAYRRCLAERGAGAARGRGGRASSAHGGGKDDPRSARDPGCGLGRARGHHRPAAAADGGPGLCPADGGERGGRLGDEVGYQVRFDRCVGPQRGSRWSPRGSCCGCFRTIRSWSRSRWSSSTSSTSGVSTATWPWPWSAACRRRFGRT